MSREMDAKIAQMTIDEWDKRDRPRSQSLSGEE